MIREGVVTRLALQDEAISTSGDYERFFIEDGVRYHHILNPRTGKSPTGVRSVSIIGPDATMTDGLSKVFVLGAGQGHQGHRVRARLRHDRRRRSPPGAFLEGPRPARRRCRRAVRPTAISP